MPIYEVRDDLLPFRKDGTESFSMLPVGTIFASAIPQIDARVHLLDGSTISQTGIYKTFANLIKSLVAAGHNITYSSDTEFYSDVSTYGQCGKFVIDDVNGTIRLPLITEFIASNNGGKEIGLAQLDELKSHRHRTFLGVYESGSGTTVLDANRSTAKTATWFIDSMAAGGEETRPKNIRYPYYIVLAAGYKSDQVVDIDSIVNELDRKQDKLTAGNGINIANGVISEKSKLIFDGSFSITDGATLTFNMAIPDYAKVLIFVMIEDNTSRNVPMVIDLSKTKGSYFSGHVQSNNANIFIKSCDWVRNGNTITFFGLKESLNFGSRNSVTNLYTQITKAVVLW